MIDFDLAKEIVYNPEVQEQTEEERYYWILFCLAEDFKQALEYAPMEQLIVDLGKRGINLRGWL